MKKNILIAILLSSSIMFSQPTSWINMGIGGGGAFFAPSINPANSNELYVATDMSSLYHSTNKGQNWETTSFRKINGSHASSVSFTNDPNIRYCISYPSVQGFDYVIPVKSIDAGVTWKQLSGNPDSTDEVFFIAADYTNPNRVIIASYNTIYFSGDGGATFSPIHTASNAGAGEHVTDVLWDGNTIYIGMIDGILQSINGGSSFSMLAQTGISNTDKIISSALAKEGSNTRFYCITANAGDVYTGIPYGSNYNNIPTGIYKMDNASGAWVSMSNGLNLSTDFPVIISCSKNDIDTVYSAGGSAAQEPGIYKFISSWSPVFKTANNQNINTGWCGDKGDLEWWWAESFFGMQTNPANSKQVIVADWGFVHMTENGGTTWKQIYTGSSGEHNAGISTPKNAWYTSSGLENTTNWTLCWKDSTNIFAGFTDFTGLVSDNSGNRWKKIPDITENSIYKIIKSNNGTLYAATSTIHDMYQSTYLTDARIDGGKGKLYFSDDGGISFDSLTDLGVSKPIIDVAIDPTNSNRMYAAVVNSTVGGIYKTDNLNLGTAATWTKVTNPPRTEGHPFNIKVLSNGDLVVSYSGRRTSQFTLSSGVFYSTDQGTTWADRSDTEMLYWTKDIEIDPHDSTQSTWYACVFSAWGGTGNNSGGLYKTINKGLTWTQLTSEYRVNSITVSPLNKDECYYTTETNGLWYSNDFSSATPNFSPVTNFPFRYPNRVSYNPYNKNEIWITTFGNGLYKSTSNTVGISEKNSTDSFIIYPNPTTGIFNIELKGFNVESLKIVNLLGEEVLFHTINNQQLTTLNLNDVPNGIYFVVGKTSNAIFSQKIIVSK